ncbi:hypothetical protein BO70DRAFT_405074 [Aspergillus heteromorphus CBS 117.55]|uniref:Uncharacterized protein n=1 Tax=Aspergillus heteromorphus CBS 117.55 TaxID=1448321 RepID=A0A317W6P0_9EURO|nr:uncharacterized protein BO70DRAFT_405074 [Aspergillus heteromorphus CBS 117.55]PWY82033.1 hypothetical protein BO70DRAFT_405074 [Aspergillus heteromorphus CBS 117.55]
MANANFEDQFHQFDEEEDPLFGSTPHPLQPPARASACFPQHQRKRALSLAVILGVCISIATGAWWWALSPSHPQDPPSSAVQDCGTSAAEALARGCQFDAMSFSWLPSACFDAPLTHDFLAQRDWQWFLDPAGQQAVPRARVLAGEYEMLYVTREYHLMHCTYMWRKMHRAVLFGEGRDSVDGYIADMAHTEHCGRMLLQQPHANNGSHGLQAVDTYIFVKYVLCGPAIWAEKERERVPGWYRVVGDEKSFTIPEGPRRE